MYSLEIEIAALPRMPNAMMKNRAWQLKSAERKKWLNLIHLFTLGKRPKAPLERVRLTATRYGHGEPDFDNLASSFKFVVDAFTTLKIIKDDNMKVIVERHYYWEYARPAKSRIKIKLEEL